ncbi:hypothetical protein D3C75_952960 [compost metagenome]
MPVQLAQRRAMALKQLTLRCRLQAWRNDQHPQIGRSDRRALRGRLQLPRLVCLPVADTHRWQLHGPQLGSHPIGDQEQVGQPMHGSTLRAGVQQQADVQAGGVVSFCLHSVVRANPQVSAHSL